MGNRSSATPRVAPYKGSDDYIFISYSHRDMATVLPILQRMRDEGYRFWYDEGIDPGSEWPESIAAHLSRCRVCLAFMSKTSLESQNCRREINFAISRNKDFLAVILEPVEMSPGMEMQISTYQSILRYKYPSESQFLEKLLDVELLAPCRDVPIEVRPETPVSSPERPQAAAPEQSPAKEKSAGPKKADLRKTEKIPRQKPSGDGKGKKKPLIIGVGAVALIAVIAAIVLLTGGRTVTVDGQKFTDGEERLVLTGLTLSPSEVEGLAKFKKCSSLSFADCTFEPGAAEKLGKMEGVRSMSFTGCEGITDLSWLAGLGLYRLTVSGCGIDDGIMASLTGGSFFELDISDNAVTRVPALENAGKMTSLTMDGDPLESLAGLEGWDALTTLSVSGCGLKTLDGLQGHQKLKTLSAGGNGLTDVEALTDLINLEELDLKNNDISTLAPLKYCQKLKTVSLRGNTSLTGLEILSGSVGTLTRLDISGVISAKDLSFLSGAGALVQLYAEGCGLSGLSGLEYSAALVVAELRDNAVTDISPLKDKPALRYLDLGGNMLTGIPDLGTTFSQASFPGVALSDNRLVSLEGLPKLDYFVLMLDGNPLTDLSDLTGTGGTYLAFDCGEDVDLESFDCGFTTLWVTDLHLSRQAQLEELHRSVYRMTPDEAFGEFDSRYNNYVPGF